MVFFLFSTCIGENSSFAHLAFISFSKQNQHLVCLKASSFIHSLWILQCREVSQRKQKEDHYTSLSFLRWSIWRSEKESELANSYTRFMAELRSKRSESRMTIHSTLTQKYSHFIRRVVLQVCLSPHLYLWAHTARCDCSPFHPHKLYHQEFLHVITANTVQMSHHQPTPTTSMPRRAGKSHPVLEESLYFVSAVFPEDEMDLGVTQKRGVKTITKFLKNRSYRTLLSNI